MNSKACIKLSNGEELIVHNEDLIFPITKSTDKETNELFTCKSETVMLEEHTHNGLIPSIADFLVNCDFFSLVENGKIYKSSSVVSISNL